MTPARRRRLIRTFFILGIVLMGSMLARFFFLDQSFASLLLGRKPGSLPSGTDIVQIIPMLSTNKIIPSTQHPPVQTLKFKTLANWKFTEGKTPIPPEVKELNGQWFKVTGYMLPFNETAQINNFVLVQSLWSCCFGQTPALNHIIVVTMEPGKAVIYNSDPVIVTGKLFVGETYEKKTLTSLYRMTASEVVVY